MKPLKQCNQVTCRTLIPFDEQYCTKHIHMKRERHRTYDAAREREDKEYRSVYHSVRWRNLRHQVLLRDDYMCQECLRNDIYKEADVADHIVELRDDISKAFDFSNLESLCHECHNRKTREVKEKREMHKAPDVNRRPDF